MVEIEGPGPEERGFLLGAALLGRGGDVADHLGEPARTRCIDAISKMDGLDQDARALAVADLGRSLAARIPVGLDDLDASWLAEALGGEPSDLVLAVVAGMSAAVSEVGRGICRARGDDPDALPPAVVSPEALADLRRLIFGPLEVLVDGVAGPLGGALCRLTTAALLLEVAQRGARVVGLSLAGAPTGVVARAVVAAGSEVGKHISQAAAERPTVEERDEARRQVAVAAADETLSSHEVRIRALGLAVLRPALTAEGFESLACVAGRLPVALGRRLLAAPAIE